MIVCVVRTLFSLELFLLSSIYIFGFGQMKRSDSFCTWLETGSGQGNSWGMEEFSEESEYNRMCLLT